VGVCCCFVFHEPEPVTERFERIRNESNNLSRTRNTEPEPTTPNPQETKQSLANPHSTEPVTGSQAERWQGEGHYRNFRGHRAGLKKRGRFFNDIGFLETSKICIGFCGDITETFMSDSETQGSSKGLTGKGTSNVRDCIH
jgi:hypothetical protein